MPKSNIWRRTAVTALSVIAIAAATAPTVAAQERTPDKLDVRDAATNQPCPPLDLYFSGTGGCVLSMQSISPVTYGWLDCALEFDLRLDAKGWAWATNITTGAPYCAEDGFVRPASSCFRMGWNDDLDAWPGWIDDVGNGQYDVTLYAGYQVHGSTEKFCEVHTFRVSHDQSGLHLVNTIDNFDTESPWAKYYGPQRVAYGGEWSGSSDVIITTPAQ